MLLALMSAAAMTCIVEKKKFFFSKIRFQNSRHTNFIDSIMRKIFENYIRYFTKAL